MKAAEDRGVWVRWDLSERGLGFLDGRTVSGTRRFQ